MSQPESRNPVKEESPRRAAASAAESPRKIWKYLHSWDFRIKPVRIFWRLYGWTHRGWRKKYAACMLDDSRNRRTWNRDVRKLQQVLVSFHPEMCGSGELKKHSRRFFLCRSFLGSRPVIEYMYIGMFRNSWWENQKMITVGKERFVRTCLNTEAASEICADKVASAEWWNSFYRRGWLAVGSGCPVDAEQLKKLLNGKNRLILKPLDNYGGVGVSLLELRSGPDLHKAAAMLNSLETPHILEEYIIQTGLLHEICPSSVNTVRVITVRHRDGSVSAVHVYVRFGHAGSVVDNTTSGGCEFFVDTDSGRIGTGMDYNGVSYTSHPDTGHPVTGLFIPRFQEMLALCREAHQAAPDGLNFAGWDVCVSEDALCIIEVNKAPAFSAIPRGQYNRWKILKRLLDEYDRG